MTTNFTIRDFFIFLLTGCIFVLTTVVTFYRELLNFMDNHKDLQDLDWWWLLLLIPAVYLAGHLFNFASIALLQIYEKLSKCKFGQCLIKYLLLDYLLLYKAKTNCAIYENIDNKKDTGAKYFNNKEEFWTICTLIQIENHYSPVEYFYYVNELFQSLILVFIASSIIAFCCTYWCIGIIYAILSLFAYSEARLFADLFVRNVIRVMKARDIIKKEQQYQPSQK